MLSDYGIGNRYLPQGSPGRYSGYYNRLVGESVQNPLAAGYAKAVALSRYHREQEDARDRFVHQTLSEAEEGKGSWAIGVFNQWSPQKRVSFEAAKIQNNIDAACTVRMSYGIPSFSLIHDALQEKRKYNPDEWMQNMEVKQENALMREY